MMGVLIRRKNEQREDDVNTEDGYPQVKERGPPQSLSSLTSE